MQRDTETEAVAMQTIAATRRGGSPRGSAAAFRASVEERLRALERELAEVKGRVNGLIFLIAGTVAAQVILRLIE
jgi:hypothetical protein